MTIRTRFAPSPTGYLHIGGVRTALFNWLLTRRHAGRFILRIDDTDAERNRPEALQPILDGFRWLGITWDEGPDADGPHGPYFQSQRLGLYQDAALELLESGHAYPDYLTKEQFAQDRVDSHLKSFLAARPNATQAEIEAERAAAGEGNRPYLHRGPHRQTPPAENVRLYREQPTTVRLKVPEDRTVVIDDLIRGKVEVRSDQISDPVILRPPGADGVARALYNFATVVDDAAMHISHVVRAAEHLSNTPVQVLIYEALGKPVPQFAHVPVVNAPNSKEKISKRKMQKFMTPEVLASLRAAHAVPADWTDEQIKKNENLNPATIAFYRALGYLPAALVNYFGRLGWSLDDRTEIMPLETMIANFSLERVNDSPASFDPGKLYWMAGEYMRVLPVEEKVEGVIPFLQRAGLIGTLVDGSLREKIRQIVEACGERLKIFADIFQYGAYFFRDPVYDPQAVQKRLRKEGALALLRDTGNLLAQAPSFTAPDLESVLKGWCEQKGIKLGDLNHVLRVATTGVTIGVGLFECLAILGREETVRRLKAAEALAV